MKREAAVIVGVIMAVLSIFNIVLTPEDAEAVQVIVEAFILAGGTVAIRKFVYSRASVEEIKKDAARKIPTSR